MRKLRLASAALLVLALLGVPTATLTAQDDDTAQVASHAAAVFEGNVLPLNLRLSGTTETLPEGQMVKRGDLYEGHLDYPDPRLSGTHRVITNEDFHVSADGVSSVGMSTVRIDNAEGSWLGDSTGYMDSEGRWHNQGLLTGAGGYEGLWALLIEDQAADNTYDVHGMIFPGGLPDAPVLPEPTE